MSCCAKAFSNVNEAYLYPSSFSFIGSRLSGIPNNSFQKLSYAAKDNVIQAKMFYGNELMNIQENSSACA